MLKEKTAKGLFWGSISNISQQIIQLFFGIAMSRILFPDDFGLVGMLLIFSTLASTMQESGFSYALINKKDSSNIDFSSVFWVNMIISVTLYVLLFLFSPLIAAYFDQPKLISLSKVVFLAFVFSGLGLVPNAILTKNIDLKSLAFVNIYSVLFSCVLGLLFALLGYTHWAIALQMVSLSLFKTFFLYVKCAWRPSFLFNFTSIKNMFSFSIKILLSNIINTISTGVYSVILGRYYDENQVGYYTQANKWYIIPFSIVYGIVNTTFYPVLAAVNNEPERQYQIFRKMLRFTSFISFPLIFGFAFVAPELIPILVTDKWNASVPIIQILCIWGMFMPIQGLYFNIFMSKGYSNICLLLQAISGIILICSLLLTIQYGIIVMLLLNLIINIFSQLLASIMITKRLFNFKIFNFLKDIFPFLFLVIIIFLNVHFITINFENIYVILCLKISISVVLYVLVMKFLNITIFREAMAFVTHIFKSEISKIKH